MSEKDLKEGFLVDVFREAKTRIEDRSQWEREALEHRLAAVAERVRVNAGLHPSEREGGKR